MSEVRTHAEKIHEQFSEHLDIDIEDVESRLENLVVEYKVPINEAKRSVTNYYLDEAGIERDAIRSSGGTNEVHLADIDAPEKWVDVTVKVVDLWDPQSDSIAQVGLIGDQTGTLKFTKWAKSDLPELTEGASYHLQNVVTDEYQGNFSVKLNRTTEITELDEDVEVGDDITVIEGALVDVQSGSGLIKRCPEEGCTRVLQNGRCSEHGEVEGEFDLRIKGVIDNGQIVQEVIFDKAATELLTDISIEEAKEMAMDALDTTVVADEMRRRTLGQYYRIEGPKMGRYILANDIEQQGDPSDSEAILIRARSM